MPYCPECGYEYIEGIEICPDCQKALSPTLVPDEKRPELELVELQSLPGFAYAEMVKEALEKAGIRCLIQSDALTSGYLAKGASAAGSVCKIVVAKKDQKRAKKIIEGMMDHI